MLSKNRNIKNRKRKKRGIKSRYLKGKSSVLCARKLISHKERRKHQKKRPACDKGGASRIKYKKTAKEPAKGILHGDGKPWMQRMHKCILQSAARVGVY